MKKMLLLLLLIMPSVQAKAYSQYPPTFEKTVELKERILFPHIYPGQTITSSERFLEDPLRPGTSTVRWTSKGSWSINVDGVHLDRGYYTLLIKSKLGPEIRQLPFETTRIYLKPDYYPIRLDRKTNTIWLARFAD